MAQQPRQIEVPHTQLAQIALSTMNTANVAATDENIAMIGACRKWLHAIARGQLTIVEAEEENQS